MSGASQERAIQNYRRRLTERGLARFEVLGLAADRALIRDLAKRLAENDAEATRVRAAVIRAISAEPARKGGIFAALRCSPLVGVDLDLKRDYELGRKIDL
jgi:hypothetical protein